MQILKLYLSDLKHLNDKPNYSWGIHNTESLRSYILDKIDEYDKVSSIPTNFEKCRGTFCAETDIVTNKKTRKSFILLIFIFPFKTSQSLALKTY